MGRTDACSSYAGYVLVLSWMSNSIRGTYKRAVGLAAVNCISQLGNIAGSYGESLCTFCV